MRKRVFLAILMIAAVALTSSCSLIVKDEQVDAQTPIIEVAGKTITKAEVKTAIENTLGYQEYMYSLYGMSFDRTDKNVIADAQTTTIDALIQAAVVDQKEAELGFDVFTAEELTALEASAKETYTGYVDSVKTNYFADTKLTGAELDQAIADQLTQLGYPDEQSILSSDKDAKALEKLKAEVVKAVTVTEDEIQAEYNTKVEAAKSSYAENLSQYGTDVSGGTTVYYRPAGYRYVKNILRKFSDADNTAISDLQAQVTAKQTQISDNATSLAALPADASTDTAEQAQSREALTAVKTQLEADLADLNTQLDAAKEKAYTALQPTVDEIVAKLAAGEDFDALMTQYGEDTGMQTEPAKSTGYLVCVGDTRWVSEFTENAMTLIKPGDVSAPFRTEYGIHIVKYLGDVTEGAVALEEVHDAVQAELLTTKQDELYNTTVAQWVKDANAKIYKDRLAD